MKYLWLTGVIACSVLLLMVPHDLVRAANATVTYVQIAPLLYNNCTTCHHPGGAGPFSLMTYQDARRWGPQILQVTQSRYMPPWLPKEGYGRFADDRHLTDEELSLIKTWVNVGMPQGDSADIKAPPIYSDTWQLGKPDLILSVSKPFTLPASGTDVFENFVLPYPLAQTHYIRAMEIRPGVPQIVHHANILIDRTASYRAKHADWQDGIPGMELEVDSGDAFDPDGHFLFWKPDTPALIEQTSMPWKLDPGNDLILNMHLKPSGKKEIVQAQVALYFADHPPTQRPMLLQLEHDAALDIPAGDRNFTVTDDLKLPIDVQVLGIYPHAHYLGKDLQAWAILPNGKKEWLIWIPSWDIDRQSVYRYRQPILLPKGSMLHMQYVYDNSADNVHNPHIPPIRVRAGNRSEDEMGHLWVQMLPVYAQENGVDARILLEEAWMQARLKKDPQDPIAMYNLAAAYTAQHNYKDAIEIYRQRLQLDPSDSRTWTALGVALEGRGDWQTAERAFQKAIAIRPESSDAEFDLASLELNHDRDRQAEEQFRALLEVHPDDASAHSGLALALLKEQRADEAEAEWTRALAIDPRNFTALYNLGRMEVEKEQLGHAIEVLQKALDVKPNDIDARTTLATAYAMSGEYGHAESTLRDGLTRSPNCAEFHAVLSQVLSSQGKLEDAIAEQTTALHLHPDDADGWNDLGVLEVRAGNREAARKDFEQALHLVPGHTQATANLARLDAVSQQH